MPDRDYYELLEVPRSATADEIKKSYRRLARKYHPDLNPDDRKAAEARFKQIQAAYDVLSEPEKRKLYDTYGSAAFQGGAGPGPGPRAGASEWPGWQAAPDADAFDFSDFFTTQGPAGPNFGGEAAGGGGGLFDEILGRVRGGRRGAPRAGRDIQASIKIPFLTAVTGGEVPILVQRSDSPPETLTVKVPPGTLDGAKLRLRGKGQPGPGGANGDLTVTVEVDSHPYYERDGRNIRVELPISLAEAVLGARVDVPTLDGLKTLTIPPGSSSGQKLRLKGQGVPASGGHPAGDLLAEIKVVVPKGVDDESRRLIQQFADRNPGDPRRGLW